MYNSEKGKIFGEEYLNWSEAIQRAGTLPLSFNLTS